MNKKDFQFSHRLRVRWAEVDMQKIVFNAHYLMYFDTAIAEYWRAMALPYEESMHAMEGDLYVKKASIEFHASARMDDHLDIALRCAKVGNSSIVFEGGIYRGNDLLITGELIYVFADPATQTSRPVPDALRALFAGFEAGESMTEVKIGPWAILGADASSVRTAVFIDEQRVPKDMEWDEADATATHAVPYNRLGKPLATGRLLLAEGGASKVGRMAVHRAMRGSGLGSRVVAALEAAAVARGDRQLVLHAQTSAEGFYRALGYVPRGDYFDEVGIAHIEMFTDLPRK